VAFLHDWRAFGKYCEFFRAWQSRVAYNLYAVGLYVQALRYGTEMTIEQINLLLVVSHAFSS
jgi:hypothetical protein